MWQLACEESWALKNGWFWTLVLEKTLESPFDYKKIQLVHSKDQSWVFFGRTDAKAETPILWPPHAKSWLIGKDCDAGRDWGQEEKGMTEDEMAGWYHQLDGCEIDWTPDLMMDREALRAAVHGVIKSRTRLSDWTELKQKNLSDQAWSLVLKLNLLRRSWIGHCSQKVTTSSEYSGLISSRIDWLDLLPVQGTLMSLL